MDYHLVELDTLPVIDDNSGAMSTNGAVLAKPAIIEAHREGRVFVSPFDERQAGNCSYDVRLGEWYYLEQQGFKHSSVINPYDPISVQQMWGQPRQAQKATSELPGIPEGTPFIRLPPGACALCHTDEFIGGLHNNITTMMHGRSSIGRSFIQVECAGWGDIGFAQRWTMEVKNLSEYRHAILVVGRRIAQIIFFETTALVDGADFYRGKYQPSDVRTKTYDELVEEWTPEMMLPKAHLDWELQA